VYVQFYKIKTDVTVISFIDWSLFMFLFGPLTKKI